MALIPIESNSVVLETTEAGVLKRGARINLHLVSKSIQAIEIMGYAEASAFLEILRREPGLNWDESGRIVQYAPVPIGIHARAK